MLGVAKSSVTRWAADGLLPAPHDTLELGRVWLVRDIEKLRGKLPSPDGRARGQALRASWESRRRRGVR